MEVRPNVPITFQRNEDRNTEETPQSGCLRISPIMPQSRLVELLRQKAYEHVRELSQYGMIMRRRDGNTGV